MTAITDVIKPFVTALVEPKLLDLRSRKRKKIYIKSSVATIYDDGTDRITVPIWGYAKRSNSKAKYLGPTIIVSKDQRIDITWINALKDDDPVVNQQADRLLFPAIASDYTENNGDPIPQNRMGVESGAAPTMGHNCEARFATHLHGGKVTPSADGMPESMILPGQSALCRYENKQRAAMLWYHDHAMHTTRLHAYAGMAGAWIITDAEETSLQLPEKTLALVIQDRNLTVSNDGSTNLAAHKTPDEIDSNPGIVFNNPNVQLLHKVESGDGPLEFAGPLTLVNGKIWPVTDVDGDWYRLRILNGANSRTYSLLFGERLADGTYKPVDVEVQQIGTDGGLLPDPVLLQHQLILAPAERVDILVNFKPFAGREIVLLNAAEAPFANAARQPFSAAPGGAVPPSINVFDRLNHGDYGNGADTPELCEDRTPYPEVMMFRVRAAVVASYDFPALKTRFKDLKMSGDSSFDAERPGNITATRTIAIVEKNMSYTRNDMVHENTVLVLWELQTAAELADQRHAILETTQTVSVDGQSYYVVAERFQDPVSFMVKYGTSERWRFINLTADTHPMHMHLVQFVAVSRRLISEVNNRKSELDDTGGLPILDLTTKAIAEGTTVAIRVNSDELPGSGLDENEKGLKDTVRVNPGEMVEVEALFDGYCGRYVYHCHLLEHEDHDMMRQFVVTRDDMVHHGMPVMSVRKN